jgi:hypothetical protein
MFSQAMPGAWIEAARQQARIVCKPSVVLWKVDYQELCAFRSKEYESASDNAAAAERC